MSVPGFTSMFFNYSTPDFLVVFFLAFKSSKANTGLQFAQIYWYFNQRAQWHLFYSPTESFFFFCIFFFFFFKLLFFFYFVLGLGHSQLTMLWQFQVNSEGTSPYVYVYPFSPKPPSHLGWHILFSRVPCSMFFCTLIFFSIDCFTCFMPCTFWRIRILFRIKLLPNLTFSHFLHVYILDNKVRQLLSIQKCDNTYSHVTSTSLK